MTEWQRKDPKYPPSKFAINFREDHPDLFAKLSENGYLKVGKEYSDDKYTYRVKEITSKKDGKKFTLVERVPSLGEKSPEQIAHESTDREYADGAKKGHEENVQMHREEMAKITELITAINALTDAITVKRKEGGE